MGSLLSALSAAVRPVFVVKRMQYVMDKTKAPLAHQYYLEWLKVSKYLPDALQSHPLPHFLRQLYHPHTFFITTCILSLLISFLV